MKKRLTLGLAAAFSLLLSLMPVGISDAENISIFGGSGGGGGVGTIDTGSAPQLPQYQGAGSTTVTPVTVSGDATMAVGGAITVGSINGVPINLGGSLTTLGAGVTLSFPGTTSEFFFPAATGKTLLANDWSNSASMPVASDLMASGGNGAAPTAYAGSGSAPSHQWLTALSAAGTGSFAQPAFTDISGAITSAQCPNGTAGATGCLEVGTNLAVTAGVVSVPTATGSTLGVVKPDGTTTTVSGGVLSSEMLALPTGQVYQGNGSNVAVATSLSSALDTAIGSTRGSLVERGAGGWSQVTPAPAGYVLTSNGTGSDPSYQAGPVPAVTATYYISTAGVDGAGCGTSGSPCASPNGVATNNTALKCGDTISAASGTYTMAAMNITATPSCPSQNNVVLVVCATPFACHWTTFIQIEASYWGVEGWEGTSTTQACIEIQPPSTATIGTIAILDNICDGAWQGGIVYYNAAAHVGNTVTIGNIVYNAAQITSGCDSGIVHGGMGNFLASGDELFAADNYAYSNIPGGVGSPATGCNSGGDSDSTGINVDTMDAYTGVTVIENNWMIGNGGPGWESTTGNPSHLPNAGPEKIRYNTSVNNMQWSHYNPFAGVSEYWFTAIYGNSKQITFEHNLASGTNTTLGPNFDSGVLFWITDATPVSTMDNNTLYGADGFGDFYKGNSSLCDAPHTSPIAATSGGNTNYGCSGNTFTTNPAIVSMTIPGAPSCSGQPDTLTCFATQIANLASVTAGTTGNGAQVQAPNDQYNTTTFVCNMINRLPASMLTTGGGPVTVRCPPTSGGITGSPSGNTSTYATVNGTLTANNCVTADANGNIQTSKIGWCGGVDPAYGLHQVISDFGSGWASRTAMIAEANATFSRDAVDATIYNSASAGVYSWTRYDSTTAAYAATVPVPNVIYNVLNYSPSWMNGSTHSDVTFVPGAGSATNGTFQTWVAAQVTAFSAWLTRYPNVGYIEFGNEDNEQYFWSTVDGTPTAVTTADQFRYWYYNMATAARSIDPTAKLSIGGIVGIGASGGAYGSGNTFLNHLLNDSGQLTAGTTGKLPASLVDAVSIHPYSNQSPYQTVAFAESFSDIGLIQTTMIGAGYSTTPLWITEWGWYNQTNLTNQMGWLEGSMKILNRQIPETWYLPNPSVTIAIFFMDADSPSNGYPNAGLFDFNFSAKPILSVFENTR